MLPQKHLALGRRTLERGLQQIIDLFPSIGVYHPSRIRLTRVRVISYGLNYTAAPATPLQRAPERDISQILPVSSLSTIAILAAAVDQPPDEPCR
jgi:hypothetical protein